MSAWDGNSAFALYSSMQVADASDFYRLTLSPLVEGDAGYYAVTVCEKDKEKESRRQRERERERERVRTGRKGMEKERGVKCATYANVLHWPPLLKKMSLTITFEVKHLG